MQIFLSILKRHINYVEIQGSRIYLRKTVNAQKEEETVSDTFLS